MVQHVREILRRSDMESMRQEFGTEYIIHELLWHLLMELHCYAQIPPGCDKREDGRGLLNLKFDLQVQDSLMEALRVMHNHQAEQQTTEFLRFVCSKDYKGSWIRSYR